MGGPTISGPDRTLCWSCRRSRPRLRWYYIPDEILDKIEATGQDNPDCEMEEEADEEEDEFGEAIYDKRSVYDSATSTLGFKAAGPDCEMWSAPPPKSIVKYEGGSRKDKGSGNDAVEASLGALPETILQKIFLYSIDYWNVWEALSLERVCKANNNNHTFTHIRTT